MHVVSFLGLRPQIPSRALPWTPLGDLCPQFPGFVPLRNKFLATPLVYDTLKN